LLSAVTAIVLASITRDCHHNSIVHSAITTSSEPAGILTVPNLLLERVILLPLNEYSASASRLSNPAILTLAHVFFSVILMSVDSSSANNTLLSISSKSSAKSIFIAKITVVLGSISTSSKFTVI
jgi:hypothetical protein